MKTVTISVSSMDDTQQRFLAAFKGKPQGAHISFAECGIAVEGASTQTYGAGVRTDWGGRGVHPRSCAPGAP